MAIDATHYFSKPEHRSFSQNVTVIPIELRKALDAQEYASGEGVRKFVRESRSKNRPGTTRKIVNHLPPVEEYQADGVTVIKKVKTSTKRKSN